MKKWDILNAVKTLSAFDPRYKKIYAKLATYSSKSLEEWSVKLQNNSVVLRLANTKYWSGRDPKVFQTLTNELYAVISQSVQ